LLHYGKRVNKDNSHDQDSDAKKSQINDNKIFKLKWLAEFSWLRYDENKKKNVLYILYAT